MDNKWLVIDVVGKGVMHIQVSQIVLVRDGRGGKAVIRTADGNELHTDQPTGHVLNDRIEAKLI